jgi:hypothetical protein
MDALTIERLAERLEHLERECGRLSFPRLKLVGFPVSLADLSAGGVIVTRFPSSGPLRGPGRRPRDRRCVCADHPRMTAGPYQPLLPAGSAPGPDLADVLRGRLPDPQPHTSDTYHCTGFQATCQPGPDRRSDHSSHP